MKAGYYIAMMRLLDLKWAFPLFFQAIRPPKLSSQNKQKSGIYPWIYENSCKQQAAAVHNTACDVLSFLSGGAVARCSVCAPLSLTLKSHTLVVQRGQLLLTLKCDFAHNPAMALSFKDIHAAGRSFGSKGILKIATDSISWWVRYF